VNQESLRDLLAQLHERLSSSSSLDAEGRDMLRTVMSDIERALGTGSSALPAAAPVADRGRASSGHASRLEALAVQFEAQHPALAGLLRQIVDLLEKAGI
jgi:hypothetical protein